MFRRSSARHRASSALRRRGLPSLLRAAASGATVASIALIGVVGASAASVGGLKTTDLGAANGVVTAHTAGITVGWSPVFTSAGWVLNGLTLIAPGADRFTAGEQVRLTIVDTSGAQVCQLSKTNATSSATLAMSRTDIDSACGSSGVLFSRIDRVAVSTVS